VRRILSSVNSRPVLRGVDFFDTAEVYGPFTNELLVGEALEPLKGHVVIATKFGWNPGPEGKPTPVKPNSRPERIRQVTDDALRVLRTRHLALAVPHEDLPFVFG